MTDRVLLGANPQGQQVFMHPRMANRHGLVAGATGTGKTITLQLLAENFSKLGVPVFSADAKGDLSGVAAAGQPSERLQQRLDKIGASNHEFAGAPVEFWDLEGRKGLPVRTTIAEMGPLLLSALMELSDAQDGVLHIAFRIAEERDWPLLNIKDLRELLNWMVDNRDEVSQQYGRIAANSVAAIQRRLLVLNDAGGEQLFGEPALAIADLLRTENGQGIINLLDARKLMLDARIYGTFLVWLLTELFEQLDEVGDQPLPRLVFFFDEAHLLFEKAPSILLEKFEQVVRLIRSKGVGVYFVTQSPADIPDAILAQCGNRIQHALRAYTPRERKALKVAAQSFRENPELNTETAIAELGVGEALVSVLDEDARPTVVQQTLLMPPSSQFGPIADSARDGAIKASALADKYQETVDRESAYEILHKRQQETQQKVAKEPNRRAPTKARRGRQSALEAAGKSFLRALFSGLARTLMRELLKAVGLRRR